MGVPSSRTIGEMHRGAVVVVEDLGQRGVADRRPQQEVDRQGRGRRAEVTVGRREPHHDVGVPTLRRDEGSDVRLAGLEFAGHLRGRVAALLRVALDLPGPPQRLVGLEVDRDVEARTRELR